MDDMKLYWCAALCASSLSAQTFSGAAAQAVDAVSRQASATALPMKSLSRPAM